MSRRSMPGRVSLASASTLRRSVEASGGSEVRVYQEMLRLEAQRRQLAQQDRMLEAKHGVVQQQLAIIDDYKRDLVRRLGLHMSALGAQVPPTRQAGDLERLQPPPQGASVQGPLELRYGRGPGG